MRVLIACEFSGRVRDAFIALGHDAMSCDLLPSETPGPHYEGDIRDVLDDGWDLMIAHPPCTDLAVSGARWFAEKGRQRQDDAVDFVRLFLTAPIPRIAVENPVSVLSTRIGPPTQVVQPWHHGHPETKATCLWLVNLPPLRPSAIVTPDYMRHEDGSYYLDAKGKRMSRIHFMSGRKPGEERWRERSRTYAGIAAAMAEQWGREDLPLQLSAWSA